MKQIIFIANDVRNEFHFNKTVLTEKLVEDDDSGCVSECEETKMGGRVSII